MTEIQGRSTKIDPAPHTPLALVEHRLPVDLEVAVDLVDVGLLNQPGVRQQSVRHQRVDLVRPALLKDIIFSAHAAHQIYLENCGERSSQFLSSSHLIR